MTSTSTVHAIIDSIPAPTFYAVATDYDYTATHKRERLTIWSGPFASTYEGEAYSLPRGDGYMVTLAYAGKVRVSCPTPRTDDNYLAIDAAINAAINAHRVAIGAAINAAIHRSA